MAATKLLVIGDQVASALSGPFLDVAKKNSFEVRVDGRPGTTAADWIKNGWLAADIDTIDPDGVFIVLGGNDAKGDAAGLVDTAKALVTQGAAKKANVGWIAPLTGSDPGLPWTPCRAEGACRRHGRQAFPDGSVGLRSRR